MSRKTLKTDQIIENLMVLTGKRNFSRLGRWLYGNDKPAATQYFHRVRSEGYTLNYEKIVERCIAESIDLNAVFGNNRVAGKFEGKLNATEAQVKELMDQNKTLHEENKKYMSSLHDLTMKSHELTLKYAELMNKNAQ